MSRLLLAALLAAACTAPATLRAAEPSYAAQVSEEQGVKVSVQPRALSANGQAWEFEVRLETHTRPLDEDLAQAARLVANGQAYAPLAWDGAPPGGHHRKGVLRFAAPTPRPDAVEMRIRLNGETAPRTFSWRLHAAGRAAP